jgi:hypothetical protein
MTVSAEASGGSAAGAVVTTVLKSEGAPIPIAPLEAAGIALVFVGASGGAAADGDDVPPAGVAPTGSLARRGAAVAANSPVGASTAESGVAASVAVSADGGAAARGAVVVVGAGSYGFGTGRALPSASVRGAGSREDVLRAVEALLGMARTHRWRGVRAACGCGDRQFMAES